MPTDPGKALWSAVLKNKAATIPALAKLLPRSDRKRILNDALWFNLSKISPAVIKALAKAGADVEGIRGGNLTPLLMACWDGHLEAAKALIDAGARPNRRVDGTTPVEAALENNHLKLATYLQEKGGSSPMAALIHACETGDLAALKKAIAGGARLYSKFGVLKKTPLASAAAHRQAHIVQYILSKSSPKLRPHLNAALWAASAANANSPIIDALVAAGADLNYHENSQTVLMTAAGLGSIQATKRLIELGADLTAIDRSSRSVLDYARTSNNRELISHLQSLRAESALDAAMNIARQFARKFGGRPAASADGIAFKTKLAGFSSYFCINLSGGSVSIEDLEFHHPAFASADNAELVIGVKPASYRGSFTRIKDAEKILGVPIHRGDGGPNLISINGALEFLLQNQSSLRPIRTSSFEELWIGATFLQLKWKRSDLNSIIPSIEAFSQFAKANIRQNLSEERRIRALYS